MILPRPAKIENAILEFFADRNFERSRRFAAGAYDPANLCNFLAQNKNPQYTYQTLHIAGTVGKGSTATYLARALQALGFRTGIYTSPHFVSLRERMCINGEAIGANELETLWNEIRGHALMPTLSFFDVMTALAFQWFARRNCHWAVIETGLGGRLDSTNNLHARAAVITRIDFDHRAILGESLTEIAREKAGIIRAGQHVYTTRQPAAAAAVIREICAAQGAQLSIFSPGGETFMAANLEFALQIARSELGIPAATLAALAREIDKPVFGRWTTLRHNPRVIFDGAHNAAGFAALAELVNRQPESQCNFFVNTMKERNLQELTDSLLAKLTKKALLYLFPMPQALYYQPSDALPNVLPVEAGQLAALTGTQGTLNIITGSMGLYAALPPDLAL